MRELVDGVALLGKGQGWITRHRRSLGTGLLPGLIALVLYAAAVTALVIYGPDLAAWMTPFADGWSAFWRGLVRWTVTVLLIGGLVLLSVVTFTSVTLIIGQPFYEAIAGRVEESLGGAPDEPDLTVWQQIVHGIKDSLGILLRVAGFGILLFACGFIPVLGQTAVPVAGFCISGFFLAEELTAVALQRRGIPVKERLRLLRRRKLLVLGYGVPLTLLFLVPVVAVFLMPGAVAGATMLARKLLPDEPQGPPFATGRDADVYDLGDGRVLRRYRSGAGDGTATAREAALMAHAGRGGVPVPAVHRAAGPDLVMDRINGPTLAAALAARTLPPAQGAAILADLHRRVHAVPDPHTPGSALAHLDLHPENVLLDPRGPMLVDWRNAGPAAPGQDAAVTAVLLAQVAVEPNHPFAAAARELLPAFAAHGLYTAADVDGAAAYRDRYGNLREDERARLGEAAALARGACTPHSG